MEQIPRHVAVIMDGNRRWADQRRLLSTAGHRAGVESVRRVIRLALEYRIEILTLFAFSSENWKRPRQEVVFLLDLIAHSLVKEVDRLHRRDVCIKFIGNLSGFDQRLRNLLAESEALTAHNTGLKLFIALNYGGQWDVIEASRQIAQDVLAARLRPEDITPELFKSHLALGGVPEVDLLIRTSGEHRISNFLLWDLAYSELFFTPVLWPDFDETVFREALNFFKTRERRYGGRQIQRGVARSFPIASSSRLASSSTPVSPLLCSREKGSV